jgi:hypothetical protein
MLFSLGALARLATFDISGQQPVSNTFVFGAPRVGDAVFETKASTIKTAGSNQAQFTQTNTLAGGSGKFL